jgi:hypothetical protein
MCLQTIVDYNYLFNETGVTVQNSNGTNVQKGKIDKPSIEIHDHSKSTTYQFKFLHKGRYYNRHWFA